MLYMQTSSIKTCFFYISHHNYLKRPVPVPFYPQKYTAGITIPPASISVFQHFILKLYNMSKKIQDKKYFLTNFLIQLFEIKYKIRDRCGL